MCLSSISSAVRVVLVEAACYLTRVTCQRPLPLWWTPSSASEWCQKPRCDSENACLCVPGVVRTPEWTFVSGSFHNARVNHSLTERLLSGGVFGQRDVPLQCHRQSKIQGEEVCPREGPEGGATLPQSGPPTQGNRHSEVHSLMLAVVYCKHRWRAEDVNLPAVHFCPCFPLTLGVFLYLCETRSGYFLKTFQPACFKHLWGSLNILFTYTLAAALTCVLFPVAVSIQWIFLSPVLYLHITFIF